MINPIMPKAYKVISIKKVTEIEWLFRVEFDRVAEVNYGQFIQISIPMVGEAPISITEFNAEEGWIEFLIRKVGRVTNVLFDLKSGDNMFLRGPYGNGFPFDSHYKDKRLVIVAGGSGCGPVRSMINAVHKKFKSVEAMDLILGFKDPSCILFDDEISSWQKNHNTILTVDDLCNDGSCDLEDVSQGRVTEHIHKLDLNDTSNMEIVIVGPPIMMKFTALEFVKHGVPKEKIWLSFERNMSCAIGKCGHCKIDETYVCLEGPVFNYTKGELLLD